MKVNYTETIPISKVVDTDEFWIQKQNDGAIVADKYWFKCWNNGEPYCYGRNDIYLNLFYAETGNRWQVYTQTIIPPEVWDIPNKAFAKLIGFEKV